MSEKRKRKEIDWMNLLARSSCKETGTELSFKAFTTGILFHPFVLWHFYFQNKNSVSLRWGALAWRNTTSAGTRREVHVSITLQLLTFAFRALKGLYYENIAILGQLCAEGFNKKIRDCLLEIFSQTVDSPDLPTLLGQIQHIDRP